jgi:malate/lactate dehydrogenase
VYIRPVAIGKGGVERVIEIKLAADERRLFDASVGTCALLTSIAL